MKYLRREASTLIVLVVLVFVVCLCLFPAFAARETPLFDPPATFEFLHDGSERQVPVYMGKGPARQVMVFCVHFEGRGKDYDRWPVHIPHVFDDPEPLPDPESVKP